MTSRHALRAPQLRPGGPGTRGGGAAVLLAGHSACGSPLQQHDGLRPTAHNALGGEEEEGRSDERGGVARSPRRRLRGSHDSLHHAASACKRRVRRKDAQWREECDALVVVDHKQRRRFPERLGLLVMSSLSV